MRFAARYLQPFGFQINLFFCTEKLPLLSTDRASSLRRAPEKGYPTFPSVSLTSSVARQARQHTHSPSSRMQEQSPKPPAPFFCPRPL